ncbi:Ig-like domain-containing protein [Methylicorpusculum oleiharenae]|uniref:Ig-like domain-containing protein n=1 Tax=Methylicorpusculum oleiharenae TaxID=1338687 RepID=UPI00135A6FB5|nr:Ig-like domain-containing protein [Methylicorpusculum oleiharenae]MCD2449111.1 Ig-like domain-containing protein [Methylicorpusculum oleiharenae]
MNTLSNKIISITITLLMTLCFVNVDAKELKRNKARQFGLNSPFLLKDLPEGRVKNRLNKLPKKSRDRAMKWMHNFTFAEHDLKHIQIDREGGILYADDFELEEITTGEIEPVDSPQAIDAIQAFTLHSKPGAKNKVYLNFKGHTITGTAWNYSVKSFIARPFDTDGNPNNFGATELTQIAEIWHRVAEDYAPFDIDVTTEKPSTFGPNVGHVLITRNVDANNVNMPSSTAGGVAYVSVWGRTDYHTKYSPALVYYNNLASAPNYIAEAASHELGHNMGLSHDGTSTSSYYTGHGSGFVSWAPIMGVGYYNNVTQWSKGEYTGANQIQDDIGILTTRLTTRSDDHGNTFANPTPLQVDASNKIVSSNPENDPGNLNTFNKGVIETAADIDVFMFESGAGSIEISVTPAWDAFYRTSRRGANLDIEAALYNWTGQLIQKVDPIDETDATIKVTVPAGKYLLTVRGTGNIKVPYSEYGSLGQYFISGSVVASTDNTPPSPNPMGWESSPQAVDRATIAMKAITATDASGTVEYQFVCVAGPNSCVTSKWQANPSYSATNLMAGYSYSYKVKARDAHGNETDLSGLASAITQNNNAPQAFAGSYSTNANTALTINLANNATDADNDPLSFSITKNPGNGSVTLQANGQVIYNPASGFSGSDTFSFNVTDSFGASATATISIQVIASLAAPDAPSNLTSSVLKTLTVTDKGKETSQALIELNWNTSDNATTYNVFRCTEQLTGTRRNKTVSCNYSSTPYKTSSTNNIAESHPGYTVRYKVTACNKAGESGFSNEIRVTP